MSSPSRNFAVNILLSILSALVILTVVELTFRFNAKNFSFGFRPSQNDRIVYELQPSYRIQYLQTNISEQGLNDRSFSLKKDPGVIRIAVVGDSTSFGWMVSPEQSFPKILERKLNGVENIKYEIINFSVPGYNTAQEHELIKEKVLPFHPDFVMLVFWENDTHVCDWIKPDLTPLNFLCHKSFFIHWIVVRLDHRFRRSRWFPQWVQFKKNILRMFYFEQSVYPYPGLEATLGHPAHPADRSQVPQKYWYMLGYDNYKIHLSAISKFLEERNIPLISTGFFTPEAAAINRELQLKYVYDLSKALKQKQISYEEIALPGDGHLSIKGHEMVANFLYHMLLEWGLVRP